VESSAPAWDAVPDPLLAFDSRREIVYANAAAREYLAARCLPLDLNLLCQAAKICNPANEAAISPGQLPVARALRGERVERIEYLVRPAPHGTSFWVECDARPLYGNEGEVEGAILVFRDITDRRKRELALESATQMRDFVYRGNLAGVVHTSVDGSILDCNDALVRMLGYSSADEIRAMRAPQLYWNVAQRDELIGRLIETGMIQEAEVCLRRQDQSRCWALINLRLLDAEPGQIGGTVVSTIIDITDRRLWEETLRQSEARFTAFMRNLPGIAFIKDRSGKYVYYSDAALSHFGKRPEEIVGRTDEEVWSAEEAARHREYDASVIAGGKLVQFVEPVNVDGIVHYWLIHKFPIMEDGRVALVGGIGIDITERRTLEEQLTQSRKMEALGRLAGGVAHDFNNLLTVISGYGQLALETMNTSPERLGTYVQEIINSAKRASGMTGQLLAFSRRQVVEPKVIDLADVVTNTEPLLRRMIGEHVELKIHDFAVACPVRADVHQIEQVLMNLAGNARDAMPLGGTLEIECSVLPQAIERPGFQPLRVLLQVRDNGVGMDDATKARIFEPFFTSKEKGKGTGLGLSTVYGIVSQAGGDIKVETEQGVGTTFRIYFPLAEQTERSSAPPDEVAPVGLETVLVVEDEPGVRALAEAVLKNLGYNVLVADSGGAALSIWENSRGAIDALLTDVIMPKMSGGELAKKLREKNPRLKILFMSGYTDEMLTNQGVVGGEIQLIQKPFTAEALARKLRSVLDA